MNAAAPTLPSLNDLEALHRQGRFREMEAAARSLIAADPDRGPAWRALGLALTGLGRHEQAVAATREAVQRMPRSARAHVNLAFALFQLRRIAEAEQAYRIATELDPQSVPAWTGLSRCLAALGRMPEAEPAFARLIALAPRAADPFIERGNVLRELQRPQEAETSYRQALTLRPDCPIALANLGNALRDQGRIAEAEQAMRGALARQPRVAGIHGNLGNLLKDTGRLAEAQQAYRHAVDSEPGVLLHRSNLLLAMNYDTRVPVTELTAEARRFGERAMAAAGPVLASPRRPQTGTRAARKPLRVGLVSGDFRQHPVGYFLESWLPHVDRDRIALFAYATQPRQDSLTARLRPFFSEWHGIHHLSDAAAAQRIHADGIDVLLDLSGHTAHGRLGAFAWRPAPVQASWLGYFATTGLPTMDWVIADRASVPESCRDHFTERLWYLPDTRLCLAEPRDAPPVAPAPALRNGFVTVGSFQLLAKLNGEVLQAWARVLQALPDARLRLQNGQLGDAAAREAMARRLHAQGIAPERVTMHGRVGRPQYLAAHAEVDLILDSFPFPGGTTTCEALWMGVPTLTLEGDRMLSRQGSALLRAAGMEDWVARDLDDYVARAVAFASDPARLQTLRASLRTALPATPLFDGRRFAHHLQQALEEMAGV